MAEGSGDSWWGDQYHIKSKNSFRFAYQNINGFMNETGIKLKSLYNHMIDHNIDVFGATEANTNWSKTSSLQVRTLGLFESRRVSTSFNTAYPFPQLYQPGGTFIIARDQLSHRSYQSQSDPRNLGRWTSLTFRGTNSIVFRVVIVYRAVKTPGALTAYNQQVTGLQLKGISHCPRAQVLEDLGELVTQWISAGERIVIAMDFNDDVRGEECCSYFEALGLREALIQQHGPGPPTYIHSDGHAVDGIFCTPTLATNIRGGYFDVGMGVYKADHRCLWIDIPLESAFGSHIPRFIRPEARRLRCQDPRIVAKYTETVQKAYLQCPEFLALAQKVETLTPEQVTPSIISQYDRLNEWRTKILINAEKRCRLLRMGGVPFSPQVTVAMKTIILWKHVLSRVKGGKYSVRYIQRLEKITGVKVPAVHHLTEEGVLSRIEAAYSAYSDVKKESKERRITFLEDLASAQSVAGNVSVSGTLKTLIHREQTRMNSRRIKAILKGNQGSGALDYVVGPDGIAQYDQVGMCRILAEENTRRFLQSQDTPFMSNQSLVHDFGRLGVGPCAEAVLKGEYPLLPDCPRGVRLFLTHIRRPEGIAEINPRISTSYYRAAFKVAKESTSSSFSGIHYGHYKALFAHEGLDAVEAAWMNAPFHLGFSSMRSQRGLDVMLEKKAGVRQAEKLRAILLFEADYNTHAKVLSRQVMANAEQWLAPEQFGSRNRHSAIAQALNKRLVFDYIRVNHHPCCWVFTDAKSCYDRIVHTPASLALQRMGLNSKVVTSLFTSIAKMKHYIRTGLGDSLRHYRSGMIPFQGVGQGNGMGPCIWAVVSSVLFDAMRSAGFGAKIQSPISDRILPLMGGAFVDDLDLFSIQDPWISGDADVEVMQRGLDLWEELLRASGGAIEPTKSEWYRIDFSWKDGVATMRSHSPVESELTCLDHSQTRRSLTLKQVDEGSKTLGVYLAPDGGNKDAVKELRKLSELCSDQVRTLRIPAKEMWQAIHVRFLKRLHYPLLSMSFTEKECTHILSPFLDSILSALGLCRKFPRAVVYGPKSFQGLGIPNLYTLQGLKHVEFILCQSNQVSRHMLDTAIELTLLEAGIPGPLFMQPFCKYVTPTWVSRTWETTRMHLDLEMDDGIKGLPLLCANDRYLMQDFANSGRFTVAELGHINRCRMFMKVYSLADISQGDGLKLAKWSWDGDLTQRSRPIRAVWPYQARPGKRSWTLWRKALKQCYAPSLRDYLNIQLGAWNTNDHYWFYSPSTAKLYSLGYTYSRGVRGTFCYRVPTVAVPEDAQPAMVSRKGRGEYECVGFRPYQAPEAEPIWNSLEAFIESRPGSLRWALQYCEGLQHAGAILATINAGHCVVVSDGSFQAGFSTAAYIISSTVGEGSDIIEGHCVVPGRGQSAFRAELGGIYAALNMVLIIVSRADIPVQGTITLGCDGKAALDRLKKAKVEAKGSHFDLISGIVCCVQSLKAWGISINMEHVRGHQDRDRDHVLSFMEELNVQVDAKAQQYNIQCREEGSHPTDGDIFGEIGPLWINIPDQGRVKITSDVVSNTHDLFHAAILRTYWKEKDRINPDQEVDWELLRKANSQRSVAQHLFTVKRVSGYIGVRKWLYRWKQCPSESCLLCGATREDISHVYRCEDARFDDLWALEVEKISAWVEDSTQSFWLAEFIRKLLLAYRETGPPEEPGDLTQELQELWRDQLSIGTDGLLNGFLTTRWREVVEGSTGRSHSTTWLAKFTIKLYDFGGLLWGKRNEWVNQAEGSRLRIAQEAVEAEVGIGSEGNTRVEALLQEGARPGPNSTLEYIQMWLTSIQVARAVILSQEDRERRGRQIMYQWLRGGNTRRSST